MKISGLENTTKGLKDVKFQVEIQIEKLRNEVNNIDKSINNKLEEIEELKKSKEEKNITLDTKAKDLETLKVVISNLECLSGEDATKVVDNVEPTTEEVPTTASVQNIEEDK